MLLRLGMLLVALACTGSAPPAEEVEQSLAERAEVVTTGLVLLAFAALGERRGGRRR